MNFKYFSLSIFTILFFLCACKSKYKEDLELLNSIITQLEMQTPNVSESFLIPKEEMLSSLKKYLSPEELKDLSQNYQNTSKDLVIRKGDIEYYDKFTHKVIESEIQPANESSCDKNIITFSKPFITQNNKKLILVWKDEYQKCKDKENSKLESYSAVIFEANNNAQWELKDNLSL